MAGFLWAQLAIQMAISLVVAIYLGHSKPIDSPFSNRIELMNECTILVLTYAQMHLTDYIPEPETRNGIGYVYIKIVLANTTVHLVILIRDTCIKGKFACRRCKYKCISKRKRFQLWWSRERDKMLRLPLTRLDWLLLKDRRSFKIFANLNRAAVKTLCTQKKLLNSLKLPSRVRLLDYLLIKSDPKSIYQKMMLRQRL